LNDVSNQIIHEDWILGRNSFGVNFVDCRMRSIGS